MTNCERLPRFARNDIHPRVIARSGTTWRSHQLVKVGYQAEIATLRSQ